MFVSGTPNAQREAAMRACAGTTPHATPEPVITPSPRHGAPARNIGITFRIDAANDQDIARLEACLQKQPGVQGFQDSAA